MSDDDRQAGISRHEARVLAGIEARLRATDPTLDAALRHGEAAPLAPPRAAFALVLSCVCLAIWIATFVGGEQAGLPVALGGVLVVVGTAAAVWYRKGRAH